MSLDDFKDQLRDRWAEIQSQLEDSPTFNSLRERYETLSPAAQKGLIWSAIGLVCLSLFSCPYGFWTSSNQNLALYEENRQMIRQLLRASRMANQMGNISGNVTIDRLTSDVRFQLTDLRLLPEQIGAIAPADPKTFGHALAPDSIQQEGLSVSVKKLNLKQVADIGHRLQGLNDSVKLAGMDIKATVEDPHYFDVIYRLIKFSLAGADEPEAESGDKAADKNGRGLPANRINRGTPRGGDQ